MTLYQDPARFVEKLHVAEDCLDLPYTKEIIARSCLPVQVVTDRGTPDIAGSYPANTFFSIGLPSSSSIFLKLCISSEDKSVIASPSFPARPVLPIRWM